MSNLATELGHLKNHVTYPANRTAVLAACNNMSDVPQEDRDWFAQSLPEGDYQNAEDVMRVLIAKA